MSEHIKVELEGGVLSISLNRPDKKNAITQDMYMAMKAQVERARTDDAVRVVLFRSEGKDFSAGNDILDFLAISQSTDPDKVIGAFQFLKAVADLDKPAVAAVRGLAVGIGLTLLLHCDMVVVAEDARLSAPFVNLALAPEAASTLLLPGIVGHPRAFEIFALGEMLDGRTAHNWGLANRAVPADQVDATARELADKLALRAPNSIRQTKALMRDAAQLWAIMQKEAAVFEAQMRSPEAVEAFTAFTEKRAPDFSKLG